MEGYIFANVVWVFPRIAIFVHQVEESEWKYLVYKIIRIKSEGFSSKVFTKTHTDLLGAPRIIYIHLSQTVRLCVAHGVLQSTPLKEGSSSFEEEKTTRKTVLTLAPAQKTVEYLMERC